MPCRGIRGAITVESNSREAILAATRELLDEMVRANAVRKDDVASAYFTTTPDLDAEFPAAALKAKGLKEARLELSFIPSQFREETLNFTVSIAGE